MNEYKERVIYQIYPASFKDSNNDGWGDLRGIISKLDYLKSLGIGIIWLSPVYASPMDDMGYDISDYKAINPRFGTMEDFDCLLKEAKDRDILIVMDLVINHTSTEHAWFKEAIKDIPNNKYRDYYIIKEGNGKKLPNNWDSQFTGTCWEKIEGLDNKYYMHLYCKTQADLNYHNEDVILEVEDIMRFWLDKGVYGFRCDVINNIYKTSYANDSVFKLYLKGEKFYTNQPGMFEILKRFRKEVLDNYNCFLVGETGAITPEIGREFLKTKALDMFFEFDHIYADKSSFIPVFSRDFDAKRLVEPIFKWQESVPWIGNYLENHDQSRSVSRYGNEKEYYKESAKMLALFLLTLKGTPFIYQGEEIGMTNVSDLKFEEVNDCAAISTVGTVQKLLHVKKEKAWEMVNKTICRDHARTPMQWSDKENAGFNDGATPWLRMNNNFDKINVEAQLNDEDSILNFYKRMIKFRNESDILKYGSFERQYCTSKICSFYRTYNGRRYLIVLNFSDDIETYWLKDKLSLVFATYKQDFHLNALPPRFAGIFEVL